MEPTTKIYRLSATWMEDHLDVWNVDAPVPDGQYKGNVWVGPLTPEQRDEIVDRAQLYAGDPDYKETCPHIERAARRVLAAITKTDGGLKSNPYACYK